MYSIYIRLEEFGDLIEENERFKSKDCSEKTSYMVIKQFTPQNVKTLPLTQKI